MATYTGSDLGARALQAEGVDTVFFMLSAPLVQECIDLGMEAILVRNETGAGMMAHGYVRATGRPGVCLTSHGPGTANVVPAIANALADAVPVVSIGDSAALISRHTDTFQEMDQVALMRPATKWAAQATHAHRVPELVSMAFRHATTPPHGPVYLDIPNDVRSGEADEERVVAPGKARTDARPYADPALIQQAIDMLAGAKKPLLITGSGVLWSGAAAEAEAFVDATGIPFYTTPQGRGVVPEDHAASFPAARTEAFKQADVVLVVGTRANVIIGHFRPPRWSPDAKFIIVNRDAAEIGHNRNHEIGIVADAGAALSQLTEEAERQGFKPDGFPQWLELLGKADAERWEQQSVKMDSDAMPIHPLRLCREVRDFLDRDTILTVDGHEILNFARQSIPSYKPFQRINAGTHGTMGVGVPFAIGAQAAHRDKRVVLLTGDGAFGWNGMEIDTAVRHKLPVTIVICNNANLTANTPGDVDPKRFLGWTRYDKMMEALGGHGEWVEDPAEIRPALDRAAASGKPAIVNVKVDQYEHATTQIGIVSGTGARRQGEYYQA